MAAVTGLPIIVAGLNLAGSLLSFIGAGFIIATYITLPRKRHFRHVLILNLATADCFNALNQSISGLYIVIKKRALTDSRLCTTNGFIVQFTVQATDCAILAIAITTVFNVTRFKLQSPLVIWDRSKVALVTFGIWLLPATTSVAALVTHRFGPASGSWCWIVENPKYLRYILTHGWRFVFIFIEIGLYTYLHFFLRKHFQNLSRVINNSSASRTLTQSQSSVKKVASDEGSEAALVPLPMKSVVTERKQQWFNVASHRSSGEQLDPRYRSIQRILLLNAYPVAYIILWIPGIANRLIELTGHTSKVTQVLQASTQFVGLANALTYGWNESIARQLFQRSEFDRYDV
ncbi:G protein-coupled glucose receptor regulating Gpa2-domain-containing protein [Cyathus striatus]|nr:G protein-coupled glucose receptor regulating Gpa2-domain-containing protein [Cyathus striatus]